MLGCAVTGETVTEAWEAVQPRPEVTILVRRYLHASDRSICLHEVVSRPEMAEGRTDDER